MKYIPAEKLIAEIERRRKQRIEANEKIAKGEIFTDTEDEFNNSLARYGNRLVYQELFEIICFIETLQQEQPVVDLEKFISDFFDKKDAENNGRWSEDDIVEAMTQAFELGQRTKYQQDRAEFAKLKAKEWQSGYDEGHMKGFSARKK